MEVAVLPNSLLIIGEEAFNDSSLKSVNIPESVYVIGEYAFSGTEIDSIIIPRSIQTIGQGAFSCTEITSVTIPKNVKNIPKDLFAFCGKLQTVIIEGAEIIEESAFGNCKKLKNISLPDTLISIGDGVFGDTGIEYLIIPQSVMNIGENNFPMCSHIAILSDETEFYLGDSDCTDYSSVTLYCNQSNKNARETAKEFDMTRKLLATFAKISADYYMTFEQETSAEIARPQEFSKQNNCETKCEFYAVCQANKEICVKNVFGQILQTLTPREERILRLIYGIEEYKESVQLVALAFGKTEERVEQIIAKALRKMRHPTRSRALRSTDVGLVLLSSDDTNYFNLWCDIFGVSSDCRQVELEYYMEKKQAEETQRKKDEEELANASAEQLPGIRKRIKARTTMIEDLDLSVRTFHWLKHAGVNTVEDLTNMTWERFIRIRNLGKKSAEEVLSKLEQLGFSFSTSEE